MKASSARESNTFDSFLSSGEVEVSPFITFYYANCRTLNFENINLMKFQSVCSKIEKSLLVLLL